MKKPSQLVSSLVLVGLLTSMDAQALTLGRLKVLSALGQPLIAEIEVPDITPEEASSLRVGVATPDAFKSAGLDYNPAIANLTIAGKRRTDGRALLEIRSERPISEPFVDLVLEITWATGRMVRDYTLLLDPQTNATSIAPTPTLPMQSAAPSASLVAPSTSTPAPPVVALAPSPIAAYSARTGQTEQAPLPPSSANTSTATRFTTKTNGVKSTKQQATSKQQAANRQTQKVQRGDTAAAIAAANKPEGVSLDQMLVAMLRANPQAFIDGNVNRLKTGAVLTTPTAEEAKAISNAVAKNNIQVQAKDFNDYRRKLAGLAPATNESVKARQATGRVAAKVEDKRPSAQAPDKLTLGKADTATEDKIAKERANAEAGARSAELKKNISDLNKIATPSLGASASLSTAAAGTATDTSAIPPPPTPLPPVAVDPAASASSPANTPTAAVQPQTPTTAKTPPILERLTSHPWALPAGAGLLGLLGLGALIGLRKRRRTSDTLTAQPSLNFPMTQHPTDTVFGAVGASQVDTSHENSAMVYPPSQLDSGTGDVDPIAEADVYLAYNRDVQAEEILKDAKKASPERIDIPLKLLEIYTKRRDVEAFDTLAQEMHLKTEGIGSDWQKVKSLARDIGSTHALFHVPASAFAATEQHQSFSTYSNGSLSFTPSASLAPYVKPQSPESLHSQQTPSSPEPAKAADMGGGLIDFDLSALTLDLSPHSHTTAAQDANQGLSIAPAREKESAKLALAQEYLSIGDKVGARALIQEVIDLGDPMSLSQAQQMLARLS